MAGVTPVLRDPSEGGHARGFGYVPEIFVLALAVAATQISTVGAAFSRVAAQPSPAAACPTPAAASLSLLPHVTIDEQHSVDLAQVDGTIVTIANRPKQIVVKRGGVVSLQGWAVDLESRHPSSAIYATVARSIVRGRVGIERTDVAQALHDPAYEYSGFILDIPTASLPAGTYTVALRGLTAKANGSYDLGRAVSLVVLR